MPTRYSERLRTAVEQAPRRIVRLWLWPGMQRTLDALKSSTRPWPGRASATTDGAGQIWHWPRPGPIGGSLETAASSLATGERLWFVEVRRRPGIHLPVADLALEVLLPSPGELDEMLRALEPGIELSAAQIQELHSATDGWPAPACWLAEQWRGRGRLEPHLESPSFRRFVTAELLAAVEPEVLEALAHLVRHGDDAEALRERWLEEPARLGALEVAERAWGWRRLGRLPKVLGRILHERADRAVFQSSAQAVDSPTSAVGSRASAALPGAAQPAVVPRFRLQLLGSPRILRRESDGSYVETRWRLRRSLSMVAFLALRPDLRASREDLIAAIWPDSSPQTIRKNFHPAVSDARRALGGPPNPIVFRQSVYMLADAVAWDVDSRRFERLVAEAKGVAEDGHEASPHRALQMLEEALAYYRGPLLEGMEAEWVIGPRQRLRRVKLDLLLQLGDLARRLDEDLKALDAYRALLLEEPFEERIHLRTMELYARQGRRDLVRRQYIRLQELLKELNVEPAAATQDRYHQLMR